MATEFEIEAIRPSRASTLTSTSVLRTEPLALLETLVRSGPVRVVTGNGAAHASQSGEIAALDRQGKRAVMNDGSELWLFPEHWSADVAIFRRGGDAPTVIFRFSRDDGDAVLEIEVESAACSDILRRPSVVSSPLARLRQRGAVVPRRAICTSAGLSAALGSARKNGSVEQMQGLVSRHGLTRLEALSWVGEPWARRVRLFDVAAMLEQVVTRQLGVQALIGNPGLSYRRTGTFTKVRRRGGLLALDARDLSIELYDGRLDSLWAVSLQEGDGRSVSSLEAYELDGTPALMLFGAPTSSGGESEAWEAFVRRIAGPGMSLGEAAMAVRAARSSSRGGGSWTRT
jgi:putative hemin transport protein